MLGQVHPFQSGEGAGRGEGGGLVDPVASGQAAVLGTLLAQDAGQPPGVYARDTHHTLADQIAVQALGHAEAAGQKR